MKELIRGERCDLTKLVSGHIFQGHLSFQAPAEFSMDFSCFAVDAHDKVLNDEYIVFFGHTESPCGAIALITQENANAAIFDLDLTKLPENVDRLAFAITMDGDGDMSKLEEGKLEFFENTQVTGKYLFHGKDFSHERALIIAEIYRRENAWRVTAVGQGFNEGLTRLLEYFYQETQEKTPT